MKTIVSVEVEEKSVGFSTRWCGMHYWTIFLSKDLFDFRSGCYEAENLLEVLSAWILGRGTNLCRLLMSLM